MSILIRSRHSSPGLLTRVLTTAGGLWFPEHDLFAPKHQNVLAVLGRPYKDGFVREIIPASNIVTDAGDLHYAQRAVSEALTNAFDRFIMCSAGTPGKAADFDDFTEVTYTSGDSEKATEAGYPTRNDADGDNSGAGVDIVSHLATYATGDFVNSVQITHGVICNAAPGAAAPILTGWAFAAAFDKTAADTLKVFVNHEMSGQ